MPRGTKRSAGTNGKQVRYAVVGLGYIAQAAVLPAFLHASNAKITALVSGDNVKLRRLGKQYGVSNLYRYEDYIDCLTSGQIDAVYIALPNNLHCEYTLLAAEHGIHVLCEKPMAVTSDECQLMLEAAEENAIKLMIAYRLHFEKTNLKAVEAAQSGKLGDLRLFNSTFTMSVKPGDIRLQRGLGGGTLYDIGIYCINAARYLFQSEPLEVFAFTGNNGEKRFREVEEMAAVVIRFPEDRLATLVTSFGAADVGSYELVGTKGSLRVDNAYEMVKPMEMTMKIGERQHNRTTSKRDQFAPELIHFSNCILKGETPEPSGVEGLADVRVIEAIYESAERGKPVGLGLMDRRRRPDISMEMSRPPVRKRALVHAAPPHSD